MTDPAKSSSPDYYARLGVSPSASSDEIRAAYRKKARETHPDRNPDDPKAAERFKKIKEAYQVLRDSEQRARYDDSRTAQSRVPTGLTINQQAPAGCGGYLWRVLAGMLAFVLFLVLEAMGVWAADDLWTIVMGVGGASLVAMVAALIAAQQFPDEATDVMLRLTRQRITMRADGHATFRIGWRTMDAVHLKDDGWTLELIVPERKARTLRTVPPVLIEIVRYSKWARLQLDLSETDVPRDVLVSFLRSVDSIPFPATD